MTAPPTRRLLVDTDPGIDDLAALLFAFGSPRLEIEALTTVWGNTDVDHCTRNALLILEALGRDDIPVYRGVEGPLMRDTEFLGRHVHGHDGLGDLDPSPPSRAATAGRATEAIVERVLREPGELDLVALGPLTNVALALSLEPAVASALRSLVVMGGATLVPGNVTPVASANFWNDPEAAAVVYRSGAPIVQSGLDVALSLIVPHEMLARLGALGLPAVDLLVRATTTLAQFDGDEERGGVHYNDLPALCYLHAPECFDARDLFVEIETGGLASTHGQAVADVNGVRFREPNVTVLLGVDTEPLLEDFEEALTTGLA